MSQLLDQLFRRRALVGHRQGRVGKSSISAALALLVSERGLRTLLIDVEARGDAASFLDAAPPRYEAKEARPTSSISPCIPKKSGRIPADRAARSAHTAPRADQEDLRLHRHGRTRRQGSAHLGKVGFEERAERADVSAGTSSSSTPLRPDRCCPISADPERSRRWSVSA